MAHEPRFEIRVGDADKYESSTADVSHEWAVFIGGNGPVMFTTETYKAGHGNAERAIHDIIEAIATWDPQQIRRR